jgi:hypothetical protein
MNVTLSIDDEVMAEARRRAEKMGTSVNQLIRDYLAEFAGQGEREALVDEFLRLSQMAHGDSKGWKFNREEIHERK